MPMMLSEFTVFEDGGFSVMARVVGQNGVNITIASISTITARFNDVYDGSVVLASGGLTVANVVFDTLQTDARWTKDAIGYNFRHDVAASAMATGDRVVRCEYVFTPASGAAFILALNVHVLDLIGS